MGTFYTKCIIENHIKRKKSVSIPKILVDTGREYTWIPGDMLLLGARTLEGLNLTVDSRLKKLVATGPLPVAYVRGLKWQREKRRL